MEHMNWIEHDGYMMVQDDVTHNITVYKDEREVLHLNVAKALSEEEIIETVSDTLCMIKGMMPAVRNSSFESDIIYDGDDPC